MESVARAPRFTSGTAVVGYTNYGFRDYRSRPRASDGDPAAPLPTASADIATVAAPAHGVPVIRTYTISARDIRAGSTVSGHVETSENVNYVEARIENQNRAMTHDAPGKFSLSYTVPWWLPPWLRKEYTLQIIARSIDGVETKEYIPIRIR